MPSRRNCLTRLDQDTREWFEAILIDAYRDGMPVKLFPAVFGVSESYPGWLAKRAGIKRRLAGAAWKRKGSKP